MQLISRKATGSTSPSLSSSAEGPSCPWRFSIPTGHLSLAEARTRACQPSRLAMSSSTPQDPRPCRRCCRSHPLPSRPRPPPRRASRPALRWAAGRPGPRLRRQSSCRPSCGCFFGRRGCSNCCRLPKQSRRTVAGRACCRCLWATASRLWATVWPSGSSPPLHRYCPRRRLCPGRRGVRCRRFWRHWSLDSSWRRAPPRAMPPLRW
mmetsp:Transcript_124144/g.358991  ORF Transcript_124144/g.358991 Transcript_124144/m.358991 type:complete len:207 (+) Transcript_124144:795-1415(+)